MKNRNCLEGIACPKCGNDGMLYIEATTLAAVTDDGAEAFGAMDWGSDSYTECPECGCFGMLREFRTEAAKETTISNHKEKSQ